MTEKNRKTSFPVGIVIMTAVITLILASAGAWFFGFLQIRKTESNALIDSFGDEHAHDEKTLYTCGMHPWIISEEPGDCPICGMTLTPKRDAKSSTDESGERVVAYWRAPDNSMEISDTPGKSASGEDLEPVYEDEIISGVEVRIDPVVQQQMGLRTTFAEKGPLRRTIRTYGHITYDETRTTRVSTKFNGWIEKLYVDFTGQFVRKADPLFDIYSPELVSVQEEYLSALQNMKRSPGKESRELVESVKRRLLYYDVAENEIKAIETAGQVKKTITIRSPFEGIVIRKNAVEGGYVKAGADTYTISDISRVWVEAHIFEYELNRVSVGQTAVMTLPYGSGEEFTGKVAFIYPYLQQKTRDVVIRLGFENLEFRLKPDMYADIHIHTSAGKEGIQIPSEAVIRSGERNIVFVSRGSGKFTPRKVTLGMVLDDGKVEIMDGVAPGEVVVTSGQFLLDSESKLEEAVRKMMEAERVVEPQAEEPGDDFFGEMETEDDFFKEMED